MNNELRPTDNHKDEEAHANKTCASFLCNNTEEAHANKTCAKICVLTKCI